MKKQCFDQGWEFTEATGFAALFNPQAWQPVTLPHDAMIAKPRTADSPTGNHGGYFPGGGRQLPQEIRRSRAVRSWMRRAAPWHRWYPRPGSPRSSKACW